MDRQCRDHLPQPKSNVADLARFVGWPNLPLPSLHLTLSLPVFGEGRVGSYPRQSLPMLPHPAALRASTLPEDGEGKRQGEDASCTTSLVGQRRKPR